MTDLALGWNAESFAADLTLRAGQLALDDGLRTAILISLFSDARAPDGAELPEGGDDRRGWWGDDYPAPALAGSAGTARDARIGSTLWLLRRSKITPQVIEQARQAAYDALAWLLRDGIASAVTVEAEAQAAEGLPQRLAIAVTLERPTGPGRQRYDFTWEASAQ